jgi:cytochrome P450
MAEQARRLQKRTKSGDVAEAVQVEPKPQDLLGRMLRPVATAAFVADELASFERQSMLREVLLLGPPKLGGLLAWAVHELAHAPPSVMRKLVGEIDTAAAAAADGDGPGVAGETLDSDDDLDRDNEEYDSEAELQERLFDFSNASSDEDEDDDNDGDEDEDEDEGEPRDISTHALSNLRYLQAVVKETLRLHSSTIISRTCLSEMELCAENEGLEYDSEEEEAEEEGNYTAMRAKSRSYTVPAGTVILVVPSLMQSVEQSVDGPSKGDPPTEQRFDPCRWYKEPGKKKFGPRVPVAAFGMGDRHCVAAQYATAAMSKVLFMLLQR